MEITTRIEPMNEVFTKFHLEGLPFDAVIHRFTEIDAGYPHDHPFAFDTFILKGGYVEEIYNLDGTFDTVKRYEGCSHFVPARCIHKIVELLDGECWTIIRPREKEKEPGFYKFENGKAYFKQHNENEFKLIEI